MRIGFVVQRYGAEILGGSEYHCRLIAERLATRHDVDVLTTCARDYVTWRNEYPEGNDRVKGVTVRRFPVAVQRDIDAFNQYSDWIFNHPHTRDDELKWLEMQGPWSPALRDYLTKHHKAYDALIFFTYLYAPTVLGLRVDPARSILVPTAHDEPAIHLGIYKEMFRLPAGIAYNTVMNWMSYAKIGGCATTKGANTCLIRQKGQRQYLVFRNSKAYKTYTVSKKWKVNQVCDLTDKCKSLKSNRRLRVGISPLLVTP